MRYPIIFTVEADDFAHARQIARDFRSALRNAEEFAGNDAKLLKLRDPAARPVPGNDVPGDGIGIDDPDND